MGPLHLSVRVNLRGLSRRNDREEARYQQLRGEQRACDLYDSELRAAVSLTDEQIEAMPEGEREYQRQLREDARALEAHWQARRATPQASPQSTISRLAESMENPTLVRIKAREQQKARNARRDPLKVKLSNAKRNLRDALATAAKQAARRAWLLGLSGDALYLHGSIKDDLRLLDRDAYLNQQAQARWRAEIDALENAIAGASQAR